MQKILTTESTTFREYILFPRLTDNSCAIDEVDLSTSLTPDITLNIPFMSAAMESVSGEQLAISLAQHGGLSVIPAGNCPVEEQVAQIRAVKRFKSGFVDKVKTVSPTDSIAKLQELETITGYSTFPVVDDQERLVGLITEKKYNPKKDVDLLVQDRMIPRDRLVVGNHGMGLKEANRLIFESGIGVLPVVDDKDKLCSVVFFRDIKHHYRYPLSVVDEAKRLRVGAAISTHPEDRERAKALVDAGVDVLVVDASDGYSSYMKETVEFGKSLGVGVVAGNVIDRSGFDFLVACGADAVKVGIGSGSICTTRRVKAIGRGQATAVWEVAQAREAHLEKTGRYVPVVTDGGVEGTGDMAIALALGADVIMMGKYFAGFEESPTPLINKRLPVLFSGQKTEVEVSVKPYWGEASARAKNVRRYQQNDPRTFVVEGEEGYVLYKGRMQRHLPRDVRALKGTLSSCGVNCLRDFFKDVQLEKQSGGAQAEGGTNIFQV